MDSKKVKRYGHCGPVDIEAVLRELMPWLCFWGQKSTFVWGFNLRTSIIISACRTSTPWVFQGGYFLLLGIPGSGDCFTSHPKCLVPTSKLCPEVAASGDYFPTPSQTVLSPGMALCRRSPFLFLHISSLCSSFLLDHMTHLSCPWSMIYSPTQAYWGAKAKKGHL